MISGLFHAFAAEVTVLADIEFEVVSIDHVSFKGLFVTAHILAHAADIFWIWCGVCLLMFKERSLRGSRKVTIFTI